MGTAMGIEIHSVPGSPDTSSSSSAVFFCIRRLTCNAAGSPRLSVVRKILYFFHRSLYSPVQLLIYTQRYSLGGTEQRNDSPLGIHKVGVGHKDDELQAHRCCIVHSLLFVSGQQLRYEGSVEVRRSH